VRSKKKKNERIGFLKKGDRCKKGIILSSELEKYKSKPPSLNK